MSIIAGVYVPAPLMASLRQPGHQPTSPDTEAHPLHDLGATLRVPSHLLAAVRAQVRALGPSLPASVVAAGFAHAPVIHVGQLGGGESRHAIRVVDRRRAAHHAAPLFIGTPSQPLHGQEQLGPLQGKLRPLLEQAGLHQVPVVVVGTTGDTPAAALQDLSAVAAAVGHGFAAMLSALSPAAAGRAGQEADFEELATRAAEGGRMYASAFARNERHWGPHIQHSHQMILEGADLTDGESVTVLGISEGREVPLEELARRFKVVRITDIDYPSMLRALERVPANARDASGRLLREKIEVHHVDLTGGVAVSLLRDSLGAIEKAATPLAALAELDRLRGEVRFPSPTHLAALQASYVISSGVSSQLLPLGEIELAFIRKFKQPPYAFQEAAELRLTGMEDSRRIRQRGHGALLEALVAPGGIAYWADTSGEMPGLQYWEPEQILALSGRYADIYRKWMPKLNLSPEAMTMLFKVLEQHAAIRVSKPHTQHIPVLPPHVALLRFRMEPDADNDALVVSALNTAVSTGAFPFGLEDDLVNDALGLLINEKIGLKSMTGDFLVEQQPQGLDLALPARQWTWVADASAVVNHGGQAFLVEAMLLRPGISAQ